MPPRSRPWDPRHLDVEAFAERAGALEDAPPVSAAPRLAEALHPGTLAATPPLHWAARGERLAQRGGSQTWLQVEARARVALTCQRCLQAVEVDLAVERAFRFVPDEARAAAEDMEAEEEVLATTRSLDLPALVEDELLLALPLVPRHEGACPQPLLQAAAAPAEEEAPRQRPFEALAALKGRRSPH